LEAQTPTIIAPQITAWTFSNSNFVVSFSTVSGQNYELQKTSELASGSWSFVVTNISGTGAIVQVTDTNAISQPQGFYRVTTGL
jgi:hypothetical protein